TFRRANFGLCPYRPHKLDRDGLAVPIPYRHSNPQSEEMIYYVSGNFGSRKGVNVGSITLHPSGLPHGPQPGLAEKSIGVRETQDPAAMCATSHPLKLRKLAKAPHAGSYGRPGSEGAPPGRLAYPAEDATGPA